MNETIQLHLLSVIDAMVGIIFKKEPDSFVSGFITGDAILSDFLKCKMFGKVVQHPVRTIPCTAFCGNDRLLIIQSHTIVVSKNCEVRVLDTEEPVFQFLKVRRIIIIITVEKTNSFNI